ncbi:unnamed protein product [Calypogeia fissa]
MNHWRSDPPSPLLVKRGASDWNARNVPVGRRWDRFVMISVEDLVDPAIDAISAAAGSRKNYIQSRFWTLTLNR